MDTLLRDFWYLAVSGKKLKPGKTMPVTLLNEPMLLGRRPDHSVFAVAEICPHRGMPLRHGSFDGDNLRCCYHGWVFRSTDGCCTEIPSLAPDEAQDPSRFRLKTWPCREVQGNIWVFVGDGTPGEIPTVPAFAPDAVPQVSTTMRFPCGIDLAATGFFDPGHPAFVHTSRWWKSNPSANLRLKTKEFEPAGMGFRMLRHHLKHGANPYRILGHNVHVDIGISLPGVRIEHIEGDKHAACVLAVATPITAMETDVHYCGYWTPRWLDPARPLATWMAKDFLNQDRMVAVKFADNKAPHSPMFVGGADVQVRWYLRLKREYLAAAEEGREFVNPLKPTTLQWRS